MAPTSLDGYIADETGNFEWSAPDEEVPVFIIDLVRPIGMYLYGGKMYGTMANGLSSLSRAGLMEAESSPLASPESPTRRGRE